MKAIIILLATLACCMQVKSQPAPADAILGTWLTGSKKAHVEIFEDKDQYFGKIVWLRNPLNDEGRPKIDKKNPEESLQKRPLLGMLNLTNFDFENGAYAGGKIYDPETGKTYSCHMRLKDPDNLDVRGYIGISRIGRTDVWFRVKEAGGGGLHIPRFDK